MFSIIPSTNRTASFIGNKTNRTAVSKMEQGYGVSHILNPTEEFTVNWSKKPTGNANWLKLSMRLVCLSKTLARTNIISGQPVTAGTLGFWGQLQNVAKERRQGLTTSRCTKINAVYTERQVILLTQELGGIPSLLPMNLIIFFSCLK
jgi:hypothetical protein